MEKAKFKARLERLSKDLVNYTRSHCHNDFSASFDYIVTPNQRMADEHLNADEVNTLKTWNSFEGQRLPIEQVVELLHHGNKFPSWINLTVYESTSENTTIELLCSRRLRTGKELNLNPFHIQVAMPPEHLHVKTTDGKFDVNWRNQIHKSKNFRKPFKKLKTWLSI